MVGTRWQDVDETREALVRLESVKTEKIVRRVLARPILAEPHLRRVCSMAGLHLNRNQNLYVLMDLQIISEKFYVECEEKKAGLKRSR